MKTEDDTYRKLVRIPFEEMYERVRNIMDNDPTKISPVLKLGNVVIERKKYYHPLVVRHYAYIKELEKGNWTVEDFSIECEKKAIIDMVEEYNQSIDFPAEIIYRAKEFFPNIKFTPAKLELE